MQTPSFWYARRGLRSTLLGPLGWIYGRLTAIRVARDPRFKAPVPVICIGNINAGGTGKTPTTIALATLLADRGNKPWIVTRGHGGALQGPAPVTSGHTAEEVGDEPLLLSAFAPTIVAKDRAAGAREAAEAGAGVILLDDGFQNPDVAKDLSIVVVDAGVGFGNRLCVPAGPLREPVDAGLRRADLICVIGSETDRTAFQPALLDGCQRLDAELAPLATGMPWAGMPVLAFAGIGRPEKFFETLRTLGVNLIHAEPLADHQMLTPALLARLEADARRLGAQLVCTEKDAVRLPTAFRQKVLTVPVRLHFADPAPLESALTRLGL